MGINFKNYDSHVYWYYALPTIKALLLGIIDALNRLADGGE